MEAIHKMHHASLLGQSLHREIRPVQEGGMQKKMMRPYLNLYTSLMNVQARILGKTRRLSRPIRFAVSKAVLVLLLDVACSSSGTG